MSGHDNIKKIKRGNGHLYYAILNVGGKMVELYLHSWRPDTVTVREVISADVVRRSVDLFVWSEIAAARDKKWMFWVLITYKDY
jgi:hypothetical protein